MDDLRTFHFGARKTENRRVHRKVRGTLSSGAFLGGCVLLDRRLYSIHTTAGYGNIHTTGWQASS
ncbi:unnamed protein product [Nippostrongylus brasiliensis]|uniref:Transposase n=1 Tax=Nippostrongylus brasiliensis TaxID=27835 RepID=A0A0N4XML2_NIPBR|nr:unnamed protein product [Nippostrongylus brasiliensis]